MLTKKQLDSIAEAFNLSRTEPLRLQVNINGDVHKRSRYIMSVLQKRGIDCTIGTIGQDACITLERTQAVANSNCSVGNSASSQDMADSVVNDERIEKLEKQLKETMQALRRKRMDGTPDEMNGVLNKFERLVIAMDGITSRGSNDSSEDLHELDMELADLWNNATTIAGFIQQLRMEFGDPCS